MELVVLNYSTLYNSTAAAAVGDPNAGSFNLSTLPSDATTAKTFGGAASQPDADAANITLAAGKNMLYVVLTSTSEVGLNAGTDVSAKDLGDAITGSTIIHQKLVLEQQTPIIHLRMQTLFP